MEIKRIDTISDRTHYVAIDHRGRAYRFSLAVDETDPKWGEAMQRAKANAERLSAFDEKHGLVA